MGKHSKYPREAGVYKLTCSINGKVYIGKSININNRLGDHRRSCNRIKGRFYFENALIKYGWGSFEVEILEILENFDKLRDNENLLDIETSYIELFDSRNPSKGYNICGRGTDRTGCKCSEETKEKLRQHNLGNISPMLGKYHTKEAKEKLRQAHLGKKLSDEHKQKIREANLGKTNSAEHREKTRLANLGKVRSDEFKEKCRQRQLGKKHSEERKEKIRQSTIGRKHSEESIEKMRQSKSKISEETREKLRRSSSGRKHSLESIEKMRQAKLKKQTE